MPRKKKNEVIFKEKSFLMPVLHWKLLRFFFFSLSKVSYGFQVWWLIIFEEFNRGSLPAVWLAQPGNACWKLAGGKNFYRLAATAKIFSAQGSRHRTLLWPYNIGSNSITSLGLEPRIKFVNAARVIAAHPPMFHVFKIASFNLHFSQILFHTKLNFYFFKSHI